MGHYQLAPSHASAAEITYTTTENLNHRSSPSTESKILDTIKKGTNLSILDASSNGWYKVRFKGKTGYISSKYVKTKSSIQSYSTTANLNVRSGPSTSYKILGTLKKGTNIKVTEKLANGWLKILFNNKTGYVSSYYVKTASASTGIDDVIKVVANPASTTVIVNKQNKLPDRYIPKDLIYPSIPFLFKEKIEKRKMRKDAVLALENLFVGAKKEGVGLLGVSAYRSFQTQSDLFKYYVDRDGYDAARKYSALPGTSEHQTGLSIDVTGANGKCAALDCFAKTSEAKWLQKHSSEYGFIIRYPKGKESITGYQYEPWHLRYIGKTVANEIMSRGMTLEEYYGVIPVNK